MDSEIDLKQIWLMIWNKKWMILIVVLVFLMVGSVYTFYFVTPEYTASTTLILVKSQSDTEVTTSDVTLNDKLISTYREMAKSDKIINLVLQEYNIKDISAGELKNKIAVTTVSDTQMLKISITDEDPKIATNIANALAEVFIDQVPEYFNLNNAKVYQEAVVPSGPSNVNHARDIAIAGIAGFAVSVLVIVLISIIDDTIKTSKDIEDGVGLTVLAELPDIDFDK
jgi:capsular polysaccharide biosynthesis protein